MFVFCILYFSDASVVEIVIDLVDINDNAPTFAKSDYFVGVSESARIGTAVITMTVSVLTT